MERNKLSIGTEIQSLAKKLGPSALTTYNVILAAYLSTCALRCGDVKRWISGDEIY